MKDPYGKECTITERTSSLLATPDNIRLRDHIGKLLAAGEYGFPLDTDGFVPCVKAYFGDIAHTIVSGEEGCDDEETNYGNRRARAKAAINALCEERITFRGYYDYDGRVACRETIKRVAQVDEYDDGRVDFYIVSRAYATDNWRSEK